MAIDGERARAEFSHTVHADTNRGDVAFYVNRANVADGPVLELGCGTGRVYHELLRNGIDADGFDISEAALSVLRDKAAAEDLEANVWQADMTDFSTDRQYALVICPFNAFQRLLTHEDQLATMQCVYDALAPGGQFIFDVMVPSFELICETYNTWQTETVEFRSEPHEHRTRARIVDEIRQDVLVEAEAIDPDGNRLFSDSHRITLLPKSEVELLVDQSEFENVSVTGDFADQQLADGDRAQVWTLTTV